MAPRFALDARYPAVTDVDDMIRVDIGEPLAAKTAHEGLPIGRLILVVSSFAPLFLIWAVRGAKAVPDRFFVPVCLGSAVLPNAFLALRLLTSKTGHETRHLVVGKAEDHRDHLLVYLFTMLIPLYPVGLGDLRSLAASLVALAFVIFVFWRLDLYYTNVLLAAFRYRIFTVFPPRDANPFSADTPVIVLTKRTGIEPGDEFTAHLLSETVLWEP
jgi:hypothetical protein